MTGRPSYYLQELMDTADKVGIGEHLVMHQFTSALSPSIAPVIAAQKGLMLQQMGTLADELLPLLQANAPTFNVNSNQPSQRNSVKIPQKQESAIPIGLRPFLLTSALVSAGDIFISEKIQEHASPGAAGLISAAVPYSPIQDHRRQHPLRRIRKTKGAGRNCSYRLATLQSRCPDWLYQC